MTTPTSLEAVLEIPQAEHSSQAQSTGITTESSDAAVLSYLHEAYANDVGSTTGSNVRAPSFVAPPYNDDIARFDIRASSPPNTSIAIDDPALRALAEETAAAAPLATNAPFTAYPPSIDDYGALGEMGGKRKKAPHERAGWADMDTAGPRKRGRKKTAIAAASTAPSGGGNGKEFGGFLAATVPGDVKDAVEESAILVDHAEPDSKESRAEQNKRAQQAFRRRREERMKDLESAAAALEPTQLRLADAEDKLRDASLALEASRIEAAALKSALTALALRTKGSVLREDGTLAVDPSSHRRAGGCTGQEMEHALELLSKQSRELAKQSREKRS